MKKTLLFVIAAFAALSQTNAQNALDFDGSNDFVQTTYAGVSGTGARTIEAWVKTTANSLPSSSGGTGQKVIVDYGSFTTGGRFTLNLLWSNSIRIEVGGNGLSGNLAINDGVWHHVAAVYNPSATNKYSLYIDGTLNIAGNLTVLANTGTTQNVMIGQRIDGINKFDGAIDEVRIWNVARTVTQILGSMNSEFCVIPSSLKAYYKANQGTASGTNTGLITLNDNSGNNNNGTLTNFALTGASSNWVSGVTLTSGNLTGGTANISGCVPYTTLGNQILTSSGTYPDTLVLPSGCDSAYTLNFTALQSSSSTITTTACDSYTTPGGGVINSSGVHYETLVNAIGCDSVITINLTINNSTSSSITTTNCSSYTSPLGHVYTISGTYIDTLQNAAMCDSLITINLTIVNSYNATLIETVCDSYTSPSGQVFTSTGIYSDTVSTGTPCDSVFTINLTVNQSTTNTITASACDEYISSTGTSYATSGTYTETIPNAMGCDSVITLILDITNINSVVTVNGSTLTAVVMGLSYRWLDCDDNYAPISGGNQRSYTPASNGNYAVKITDGICVDTSLCVSINNVGVNEVRNSDALKIYPNPASNNLFIQTSTERTTVFIQSISGGLIRTLVIEKGTQQFDVSNLKSGLYFINYTSNNNEYFEKLIIQ